MDKIQSFTSNASGSTKSIKVTVLINDLQRLSVICKRMTKSARERFDGRYGRMLNLLLISVEGPMLSALTQFWNPNLRCFELPGLDLVPTIEEYDEILDIPHKKGAGVYFYKGSRVGGKKIAKLIGLQADPAKLEETTWKKILLEDHLEKQAELGNWENFNKTLALLIYGLVLFPFKLGMVDQEAMDVFYQYEMEGATPVPAILADTLLSADICRQNKGGTLKCCSHLLYVWIITHLYAANHMGLMPDPLKNFPRIPIKKQEARAWKEDLLKFDAEHFPWVCPWYHPKDIIFNCGAFPNVPLMGSRGCISYTPAIALRQLKWTQVIPRDEHLDGWSFQYGADETKRFQADIRIAWGDVRTKGGNEFGKARVTASEEYKNWRKTRSMHKLIPKETPHQGSVPEVASLTSQLEAMRAQMKMLEEKEEQAQIKIESLQRQCRKKERDLERHKNECADVYENSRKKGKNEKEMENALLELKKMQDKTAAMEGEIIVIKAENERWKINDQLREQEVESLQQELLTTHAEVVEWKNLASDRLDALTKSNQMNQLLQKKTNELVREQNWQKSEVQRLEREKRDLLNEPLTIDEHYKEKMKEWRKKYGEMINCVQNHTIELSDRLHGAMEEIDMSQLPMKTYMLIKYCHDLTRSFR